MVLPERGSRSVLPSREESLLSKQAALFQSIATSCAAVVALAALAHEVVGAKLVPWGVELFGGPLGFYGAGAFGVVVGLSLVAGTLRLIPFAVSAVSFVVAVLGALAGLYAAVVHREFHFFAWVLVIASLGAAMFHSKAIAAQPGVPADRPRPAGSARG